MFLKNFPFPNQRAVSTKKMINTKQSFVFHSTDEDDDYNDVDEWYDDDDEDDDDGDSKEWEN